MTAQQRPPGSEVDILIVEDSAIQATLLKRTLVQHGYVVTVAKDGAEGLAMIRARKPTLVISDIEMRGIDGYTMCREIKRDEALRDIPVILLTSLSDPEDIVRGLHAGADNYLTKPYDESYLLSRIDYVLTNRQPRTGDGEQGGIALHLAGKRHRIDSDRQQILDLLISTFENAVRQNRELLSAQLELRAKNAELEETLRQLHTMQDQVIAQEKLASLGALTAGIAHEIRNPLNFVTNFAELSNELLHELHDDLAEQQALFDPETFEDIADLLASLQQNVQKITEHGKRADRIVNGMLQHSRGQAGVRQPTDINLLLSEDIDLAYHGMRAQDTSFNVSIDTLLDPTVGSANVVSQDISRVFLNILNNALYAVHVKHTELGEGFRPTLSVRSTNLGDRLAVRIRDNGNGIPPAIRDKLFQPFFTTKPTGSGTGLGLSISRDIVVQEHQGTIEIDSEVGQYTEFIITFPRQTS
jgi:signal transduction histidine kinase